MGAKSVSMFATQIANNLANKVQELCTSATDAIAQLDQQILQKELEYLKLTRNSVRRDEAAALIVSTIKESLRGAREDVEKAARGALNLHAFKPISHTGWHAERGLDESQMERKPLVILDAPYHPLAVAAIGVTDEAIEAFALRVVTEAGAPEKGPSVEELHARAQQVLEEIRALYAERMAAKEKLKGFVEVGAPSQEGYPSDHVDIPTVPPTYGQRASVKVRGEDGNWYTQSSGRSNDELLAFYAQLQRDGLMKGEGAHEQ